MEVNSIAIFHPSLSPSTLPALPCTIGLYGPGNRSGFFNHDGSDDPPRLPRGLITTSGEVGLSPRSFIRSRRSIHQAANAGSPRAASFGQGKQSWPASADRRGFASPSHRPNPCLIQSIFPLRPGL